MTWGDPPKYVSGRTKASKTVTPESLTKSGSEDGEQAALFCWAALNVGKYPALKWLYAIPNGGFRHIAEAAKFVATGTRAGIPDICLPCPNYICNIPSQDNPTGRTNIIRYAGCYIELKKESRRNTKNGGCTQEQLNYLTYLTSAGYFATVCYSWIEAKDVILNYLDGKL